MKYLVLTALCIFGCEKYRSTIPLATKTVSSAAEEIRRRANNVVMNMRVHGLVSCDTESTDHEICL